MNMVQREIRKMKRQLSRATDPGEKEVLNCEIEYLKQFFSWSQDDQLNYLFLQRG